MLWTLMHVWGGKKGMFDEAMQTQLHYLNHACAPAEPWRSGRDNFKVAGEGGGHTFRVHLLEIKTRPN